MMLAHACMLVVSRDFDDEERIQSLLFRLYREDS